MAIVENQIETQSTSRLHEQPEDSTEGEVKPADVSPDAAVTTVQHAEPEDAYLTGGQRNLQRRVLGLNVENPEAQRPADPSPGLHSTGSFTGTANGDNGPEAPAKPA